MISYLTDREPWSSIDKVKALYGCLILVWLMVFVWAAFDIHNRIHWVLIMQAPALLVRGILILLKKPNV